MTWPLPRFTGDVVDIGSAEAERLLDQVPAADRLYTLGEMLMMFGSWGYPIDEEIEAEDVESYVEHMAAGGYVIGRPVTP